MGFVGDDRLVREVEKRIEQLIELSQRQAMHIDALQQENKRLSDMIDQQQQSLSNLNQQLSIATQAISEDPRQRSSIVSLQSEIAVLMREVDGCIALLEKSV